jgi:hypothetical protein
MTPIACTHFVRGTLMHKHKDFNCVCSSKECQQPEHNLTPYHNRCTLKHWAVGNTTAFENNFKGEYVKRQINHWSPYVSSVDNRCPPAPIVMKEVTASSRTLPSVRRAEFNPKKPTTNFNPLKTDFICFIQGLSAYRAVNTLHFGYKNQSLNVL